ncbi:vanadium-dependent haloperoxidase, partial [Rudaea sp.]|uniref:vanadium-dependent haloperoxidase n=1 Tax=Rudaea sp. TaxID=2136325 RepID=UPI002ED61AE7
VPWAQARGARRAEEAFRVRIAAAQLQKNAFDWAQDWNGDENLPGYIAVYSKGLPHNDLGEVDGYAYWLLLQALNSGSRSDLAAVPIGNPAVKFANPRSGLAFSMSGQDAQGFTVSPAPTFDSAETAAEMVEAYWGALTRDVPFTDYAGNATIASAIADLATQSGYTGPRDITPDSLFRMNLPGAMTGPWLSQFFWMPLAIGPYSSEQVVAIPAPGLDYVNNYAEWLAVQRGGAGGATAASSNKRYISNARDLTRSLQLDAPFGTLFMHETQAALNLNRLGLPRNPALPAWAPNENAALLLGVHTLYDLIARAGTHALDAVFWQKWQVHRRIRPETFSGRVDNHINGKAIYPINAALLNSQALAATFSKQGNYLLSQAWKGGCPFHPSYPSAHTVIAGAAISMIKAFFKGDAVLLNPVQSNADGSALVPYTGDPLTVEGELNKMAMNIGISRVQTGIHYRSDAVQSLYLGEKVAISMLAELKSWFPDKFDGFKFRGFAGNDIVV